jgi:hypothetical protein
MMIQPQNLTSLLNHVEIMWWQFYVKHWFIPGFCLAHQAYEATRHMILRLQY